MERWTKKLRLILKNYLHGGQKRQKNRAANYWDKHMGEHLGAFSNWEANAPVMRHQNARVSGDGDVTPLDWFWKKYGPFREVASIGSGTGVLERHLCSKEDFNGRVIGFDISPQSLKIARDNCAQFPNTRFEVADMNTMVWKPECFDVVLAHGILHHVEALDWCLGQIRAIARISKFLSFKVNYPLRG